MQVMSVQKSRLGIKFPTSDREFGVKSGAVDMLARKNDSGKELAKLFVERLLSFKEIVPLIRSRVTL